MAKKIVILGYSNSVHVTRWAQGISRRGYNVTVLSLGGDKIDGVETINLPVRGHRRLAYINHIFKVKKIIRDLKPDLLHAHFAVGNGLLGKFSSCRPFLLSVWGADIIDFPSNYWKRFLLKKILSSADYLTATSHFLKKRTLILCPNLKDKIKVIPFGVMSADEKKMDRSDNIIKLCFIKVHRKKYGPDVLLLALSKIIKHRKNIYLNMAGEGELTEHLKRQVKELNLEDYVSFVGFIKNQKMPDFLAQHDIMVMPSIMDSESFGVAVLEASAVGIPVVAGAVGGVPEVLIDGETGILVPPGDAEALAAAIMKLADDAELRDRMGRAGRRLVEEKYLWGNCLDKMTDLYDRITERKI